MLVYERDCDCNTQSDASTKNAYYMAYLDFIQTIHQSTKRNYLLRVTEHDKPACSDVAKKFDQDFFDGDRMHGYGGYRYDGRWIPFAEKLIAHYDIKPGDRILDIGCGKGFLVHDFMKMCPGVEAFGMDISDYAIENAMPEIRDRLKVGHAKQLDYEDNSFDLVVSINTVHNLYIFDLATALSEMERVGKNEHKYIVVDSYRNEAERANLMYWQITCECFYTPDEWDWLFKHFGYTGDFGCIYCE